MQYLGGKARIAKALCAEIDKVRQGRLVWDAFCGGLSMARTLRKTGPVWASDANVALINMYLAVQAGWAAPEEVSEDEYRAARKLPDTDPRKAFIGFGCSFGGKWFGGRAKPKPSRSYSATSARIVKRDVAGLVLWSESFLAVEPEPFPGVLYLDPPYAGTTGYAATGHFDHGRFWALVEGWAMFCPVFVSEYSAPIGRCVLQLEKAKSVAGGNGSGRIGVEHLYLVGA